MDDSDRHAGEGPTSSGSAAASQPRNSRLSQWSVGVIASSIAYVLSSGPVLAGGCWLRETTDWDGFYAVFWLYVPLLYVRVAPLDAYVSWWFRLFGTVGPG